MTDWQASRWRMTNNGPAKFTDAPMHHCYVGLVCDCLFLPTFCSSRTHSPLLLFSRYLALLVSFLLLPFTMYPEQDTHLMHGIPVLNYVHAFSKTLLKIIFYCYIDSSLSINYSLQYKCGTLMKPVYVCLMHGSSKQYTINKRAASALSRAWLCKCILLDLLFV